MNGATVKVYSMVKDGADKVADHFRVREFACQDGSDVVFLSPTLVEVLEDIRIHFGKPISVTSGYRTVSHNRKVNGSAHSQHLYGMAADIVVTDVKPSEVAAYAEKLLPNTGGIGRYATFTHVDVRAVKSRWKG